MAKRKRSRSSRQPPSAEPPTLELLVKRSRSSRQSSSTELPTLMFSRSEAAEPANRALLDLCRRQYEQGDHRKLLEALFVWLSTYRGPPAWIADAFCEKLLGWFEYRAPTLDAAFGVKRPHGKHLHALRERQALRGEILLRIENLRRQNVNVDVRLFELVGAEIGRSASFVSTVYYEDASVLWRKLFQKLKIRTMSEKHFSGKP
jgi:hypothetical protein